MRKFIIREDVIKSVQKALKGNKDVLHDFDTGLCTLSPYMPSHLDLGKEDCCGIFMGIDDKNIVICNECEMTINDAISKLRRELRSVINMPCHADVGDEKCCGIFIVIKEGSVFCNECDISITDAIERLKKEDCSICNGLGYVIHHHDPCTECDGRGKVGGG